VFNKKKYEGLTMQNLFSDEFIQISLEKLDWTHVENNGKCYESSRMSEVGSKMVELLFRSLLERGKVTFGNYSYECIRNRLERHGPSIVSKAEPKNKLYTLGKQFRQWIDVDADEHATVVKIT